MSSNHEDAIASLMNEMREQQGYSQASESPTTKKATTSQRLLPELDDYPDNSRCAGSHSIWNPHVVQDELPSCGDSGNSTIIIPTNPQVEVLRRRAFEKFKQECLEGVQRTSSTWNLKLPIPSMLEKWHMDAKLQERQQNDKSKKNEPQKSYPRMASTTDIHRFILQQQKASYYDPILLYKQTSPLFVPTFRQEVQKAWKKTPHPPKLAKKSQQVQKNLHRLICETIESFQQQLHQTVNQLAMRSTDGRRLPKIQHVDDHQVDVTYSGVTLRIHLAYFEKLQRLFDRAGNNNNDVAFEEALFCLLCRYDMLQGAGLQAGVPGKIMDVLLERLDCRMECFASPLNCRYQNYASAFPDVDGCFGSVGSFFHLDFSEGGCYQANPPFCEGLIAQMNDTMRKALNTTTTTSRPLMFVVFCPAWKEAMAYQQLLVNEFLTKHLLLEQGKHWYTEGTQHRRKGSFRVASFDTSIFFYQNDAAKSKWTIDDSLLEQLKESFCQDPGVMEKSIINPTKPLPIQTTEIKERAVAETTSVLPSSNQRPPTKASKKQKGDKKRKWSKDHKEENEAQLDLLQSLGLISNSDEPKQEEDVPEKLTKKPSKKKTKKRR